MMRLIATTMAFWVLSAQAGGAQSDQDFSGLWKFNPDRSEPRSLPVPPDPFLKVEQTTVALTSSASSQENGRFSASIVYPLNGKAEKRKAGESTANTVTKWEGSALLVNTLVSGPRNYTVMERWTRSRDGSTLTIKRTIVRMGSESESVLV